MGVSLLHPVRRGRSRLVRPEPEALGFVPVVVAIGTLVGETFPRLISRTAKRRHFLGPIPPTRGRLIKRVGTGLHSCKVKHHYWKPQHYGGRSEYRIRPVIQVPCVELQFAISVREREGLIAFRMVLAGGQEEVGAHQEGGK